MMDSFIQTGTDNYVMATRIIGISSYDSAPMVRLVKTARKNQRLVDQTEGKKTKSVIQTDAGYIIISHKTPTELAESLHSRR